MYSKVQKFVAIAATKLKNLELEHLVGFLIIPLFAAGCGFLAVLAALFLRMMYEIVVLLPFGPPIFFTIFTVLIVCYVIGFFLERQNIH